MKKYRKISVCICVLSSVILAGCWQTETATTDNVNQMEVKNSGSNNTVSETPVDTPAAVADTDNTSLANLPNSPTTAANNTSVQTSDKNTGKDKKSSSPVETSTPVVGSGANDMFMFVQIRGKLDADRNLSNAVMVEVKEGNVTLVGNVSSQEHMKRAEQLVREVNGVKSVKNNLRINK